MDSGIKDCEIVEEAGFTPQVKAFAHTVVISLRYLQELAKKRGIPMESIEPRDVVDDVRQLDEKTP